MIARRWHGRVPAAKADEYLTLSKEVGLADYRSTEGNRGAWCLHRREGGVVHVEMFTLWDDLEAIRRFARIYEVEGELKGMSDEARKALRQELAKPLWEKLREWLEIERRLVADGGAAAEAIDYTLNHWAALTRHLDDGAVAVDNNHLERQIKPWAMGRRAWLFAGSELAGQRAAIVMSLVQSARLNGHEPWAYLRDVLARLPTQLNSRIEELLPHRWQR